MNTEKYCIHCKKSEKEIRKERRLKGYRVVCFERATEMGFHSFGVRCIKCKKHWTKCECKKL